MSAYGEITEEFGDGEHTFRLGYKEISQFEEKFDLAFMAFINRIAEGNAKIVEVREIIRLGLIGGGMEAPKTIPLLKAFVEEAPLADYMAVALKIAQSGAFGSEAYRTKKAEAKSKKNSQRGSTSSN